MNHQKLLHSPIIPSHVALLIQKAAHNSASVLIQGEPGTKKELIAKAIHYTGDWKYFGFYNIDCKFLTENTLNNRLSSLLKEINYGTTPATLFLKEVGYLGEISQLKLLELMEDGIFQNDIEKKMIKNLRFISSSSENLKEKVTHRKFSEDLYDQLNALLILVPPLRERSNEFSQIAQYILTEYSKKAKIKKVGISNNVLMLLQNYWWPGNLRELEKVIIRSANVSESGNLMEEDLFFETKREKNSFISFLKKTEKNPTAFQSKCLPDEIYDYSLSLLFIELVHRIKNPLVSIKTFTQLLPGKFSDGEFREYFYRIVTDDIEKIDTVLNTLLNYIKINTPIEKKGTVQLVFEDILKKQEDQFEDKRIKIFKKFEKELPETVVHDEQLRYILDSILRYAVSLIPLNGSLGILTKSLNPNKEKSELRTSPQDKEKYIEIVIVFTGLKKPIEPFETILGIPSVQQEEAIGLELRLAKEIVEKNHGVMKLEVDPKKPRTFISLKFPTERRKVTYFQLTKS